MITTDTVSRYVPVSWSLEELEELAHIANDLGLAEPANGYWPELADAFRDYLG